MLLVCIDGAGHGRLKPSKTEVTPPLNELEPI